jgi:hypothetical protein
VQALALKLHIVTTSGNGEPGEDGVYKGVNDCANRVSSDTGVVIVGATDVNDARASFSNFGSCVDIFGELGVDTVFIHGKLITTIQRLGRTL